MLVHQRVNGPVENSSEQLTSSGRRSSGPVAPVHRPSRASSQGRFGAAWPPWPPWPLAPVAADV